MQKHKADKHKKRRTRDKERQRTTQKHQTQRTTHKPTRPMGNRCRLRTAICHGNSRSNDCKAHGNAYPMNSQRPPNDSITYDWTLGSSRRFCACTKFPDDHSAHHRPPVNKNDKPATKQRPASDLNVLRRVGFQEIGGYSNLKSLYFSSIPNGTVSNTTCGLPRPDAFSVFLDPVTGDQPWPGLVLQATLGGLWYWDNDQHQSPYPMPKEEPLLAGTLKLIPLFIMVFPGMISRILFTDEVACVNPATCKLICDNEAGCSNIAYPKLVLQLLPTGNSNIAYPKLVLQLIPTGTSNIAYPKLVLQLLPTGARGLLMAVMLSAIMSSLTSIFNSASTLFTMDIWKKIRKSASQRELLIVGRLFVVVMCVMAILWLPMIKVFQSGRLFSYINAVQGYIGSTLGVTFLFSVFWTKTTEAGAFYGFLISQCLGVVRLVVEALYPGPPCGDIDTRPMFLKHIHYLYFIQIQQVLCIIATVVISLCTKPQTDDQVIGMFFRYLNNRNCLFTFILLIYIYNAYLHVYCLFTCNSLQKSENLNLYRIVLTPFDRF
ncbi:hypothetical protein FSP39_014856 [Pinctada imbricata]|uniref:Sodium/myo-inositol cotransporter 2 n=1 Tax=Pinctada imbricata TaxID=66713 RepID=A0AA89BVX7_PINIB|nr:hypothetical protein FSP39_014856 [Pinctada imbricata]